MLPSMDLVDSVGDDSRGDTSSSPPSVWQNSIASYLLNNMDNINSSTNAADQKRDANMQEQLGILVRELVKIQREKKTNDAIAQLARLQLPQPDESHQLLDDIRRCLSVPQKLDRSISEPFPMSSQLGNKKSVNQTRYKTELCRQYEEKGQCRYGEKCQFAHGDVERRSLDRHPKYKTEMCRTYHQHGFCNYGLRCNFIHDERLNGHGAIGPHSRMATPLLVSPGELHLGGGGPSSGSSGRSSIHELSRSVSTAAGYASFARPSAESPTCSSVPSPFEGQLYPLDPVVCCAGRISGFSPHGATMTALPSVEERPRGRPILSRSASAAVQSGACGSSGRIASPEVFRFDYSSFAS